MEFIRLRNLHITHKLFLTGDERRQPICLFSQIATTGMASQMGPDVASRGFFSWPVISRSAAAVRHGSRFLWEILTTLVPHPLAIMRSEFIVAYFSVFCLDSRPCEGFVAEHLIELHIWLPSNGSDRFLTGRLEIQPALSRV
jgi:hypothetical protein